MEIHPYDMKEVNALVVVSAKEHGRIYRLQAGTLEPLQYVAEHPPEYSDNEGFFTRSAGGIRFGSGNVRETADAHNLDVYIKAITGELRSAVVTYQPEVVFVFEPEHLKGLIKEHLAIPNNILVTVLAYGNYVEKTTAEITDLVHTALSHEEDPTDPASVAGEAGAAEKRKILEIGKQVSG